MVVFPAASSPTIKIRISFFEKSRPNTCSRALQPGVCERAIHRASIPKFGRGKIKSCPRQGGGGGRFAEGVPC